MGIAALILGVVSVILGWIPFVCFIAFITAIIGLILGIVDTVKKTKSEDNRRIISIIGLIISAVAIPIIIFTSIISLGVFLLVETENYNYDYEYDWYDDYYYDDYNYNYNWREYTNKLENII